MTVDPQDSLVGKFIPLEWQRALVVDVARDVLGIEDPTEEQIAATARWLNEGDHSDAV